MAPQGGARRTYLIEVLNKESEGAGNGPSRIPGRQGRPPRLRQRTRFPPGLYKLVDLANRKAQSEQEFRTYLREIEWHLKMT